MKNIFVLRYFMLIVAVFTAGFQSFHILEHSFNSSKELVFKSHNKKQLEIHYDATDCSICSVILHSSPIKEVSFCKKVKNILNTTYSFFQPKNYYHLFAPTYFSLRAPPVF